MSLTLHGTLMARENTAALLSVTPYNLHWFLMAPACRSPELCLETYKNFAHKEKLSSEERVYLQAGVAQKLLEAVPFHDPAAELSAAKKNAPADLGPFFDYYFGYEVIARNDYDLKKAFLHLKEYQKETSLNYSYCVLGFFRAPFPQPEGEFPWAGIRDTLPNFPTALVPVYWRQRGFQWAEYAFNRYGGYEGLVAETLKALPQLSSGEADYFLQGIGLFTFFEWQLEPYRKHPFWDTELKNRPEISTPVLEGAGMRIACFSDVFRSFYIKIFLKKFSKSESASIKRGILEQEKLSGNFLPHAMV